MVFCAILNEAQVDGRFLVRRKKGLVPARNPIGMVLLHLTQKHFFSAAIDCFTSNVSGGGCHWLPTTDFTDRYPWHKQSANALRGTNKSEPCRSSLGKLNGRCLGEID